MNLTMLLAVCLRNLNSVSTMLGKRLPSRSAEWLAGGWPWPVQQGDLFCVVVDGGSVWLLPLSGIEDGVYAGGLADPRPVASDVVEFLERLLAVSWSPARYCRHAARLLAEECCG